MTGSPGTGTVAFLRLYLRRDRWLVGWWALGITLLYYSQAVSVDRLYATPEEFARAAASMERNAAFIALAGPARALDTIGGQVTWQASAYGAIAAGLMSMFLVGRHTRAEEETGRDELLRAAPVGRRSTTTAALLTALAANAVTGGLVAASLASYPLAVADSVALGVGLMLVGWLFTGVALLAAQVASTTRAAYGLTGAVIGGAYALRAVGDVGTPWLTWLSPIGWYQGMYPFSGLRWWPALLLAAAAGAAVLAAYAVFDRRDFGSGLLAARPGPGTAGPRLRSGLGLAWRLQWPAMLGWAVGLALTGLVYGSIGSDVGDLLGESDFSRAVFTGAGPDLVEGFYAVSLLVLALLTSGFAVSSALRPRAEEDRGRLEWLLASGLGRIRWLFGHLAVTLLGVVLLLVVSAVSMGLGYALVTGDSGVVGDWALAVLSYLPPVLVLVGLTVALHGLTPRAASLSWLGLGVAVLVMLFGELFRMPQWLRDVSPFEHVPAVPVEAFDWGSAFGTCAVALGLLGVGAVALARRDLH